MSATISQFYMPSKVDGRIHKYHRRYNPELGRHVHYADGIMITAELYLKRLSLWLNGHDN